jgi:FAD/FMN-containing dehydrogenase
MDMKRPDRYFGVEKAQPYMLKSFNVYFSSHSSAYRSDPTSLLYSTRQGMETHKATVASLASQVAHFSTSRIPFRIYHGSTLSTRQSARQRNQIIDVSSLNHVLEVNASDRTMLVEPNVAMDKLVEATLAHGLLPKVVMELPNITVGGG